MHIKCFKIDHQYQSNLRRSKSTRRSSSPRMPWCPKPRATRKLRPSCSEVLFALSRFFGEMAGDGAVDIDLYAQVDEFEPDVTGQVIFWSLYVKERICLLLTVLQ